MTKQLMIKVSDELYDKIDSEAEKTFRSKAGFVRAAIAEFIQ